jgi:hypothetical protein
MSKSPLNLDSVFPVCRRRQKNGPVWRRKVNQSHGCGLDFSTGGLFVRSSRIGCLWATRCKASASASRRSGSIKARARHVSSSFHPRHSLFTAVLSSERPVPVKSTPSLRDGAAARGRSERIRTNGEQRFNPTELALYLKKANGQLFFPFCFKAGTRFVAFHRWRSSPNWSAIMDQSQPASDRFCVDRNKAVKADRLDDLLIRHEMAEVIKRPFRSIRRWFPKACFAVLSVREPGQ